MRVFLLAISIVFNSMVGVSQTLTISASGENTPGTNWSISGNTLSVSGTANIRASVIANHLTSTGPLTVLGNSSNFQVTISEAISVATGSNSLVIGASDNKGAITTTAAISIAGSISVYGGWFRIENDLATTSNGAKILAKANGWATPTAATDGYISLSSTKNITTNGGDIVLWSNAQNITSGQANNEIILGGSNTLSTSGGKIVLAGGLDTDSDGIPNGYAYRGSYAGESLNIGGNVTLNSGGGDIIIRGEQNGSDVAIGADATFSISNAGAVTIEGKNTTNGSVTLGNSNITSTTTNASVSLLGSTHIWSSGTLTVTTNGGDVWLAANIDDATDGESTTNGSIRVPGLSITTYGGDITLGGSDAIASGYAIGSSNATTTEGIRIDGTLALNSGGGNIALRGKSYAVGVVDNVGAGGIMFYNILTGSISSGAGTILLDGYSQTTGGNAIAGILLWNNPTPGTLTIESANTTAGAITLNGFSTGSTGQAFGIEVESTITLNLLATASGGGITVNTGNSIANFYDAVFRGPVNMLAVDGPISFKGGQFSGAANGFLYNNGTMSLGSKSATSIASSSSNLTILFDRFDFPTKPNIATTGTVTIQPAATSFGESFTSDKFNYNQNSQTMTGLTFGKSTNTSAVTISSAQSVAGPITVYGGAITINQNISSSTGGLISLFGNTLTLGAPITLVNGDIVLGSSTVVNSTSTNYFKTTGTGTLKRSVANGSSFTYPVGNGAYNPVTIANNTGSADEFSVRVADAVMTDGTTGTALTDKVVKRTWHIGKTNPNGNSGVDMTFQWNASEEGTNMTNYALSHYGTYWAPASGTSGAVSGTDPKTMTHSGYTGSFSPFAIGSSGSALPVSWLDFTAKRAGQNIELNWQTASEQNTKDFQVEHSINAQDWTAVGTLPAAGNSHTVRNYRFVHEGPFKNTIQHYYRILQRDLDGKFSYSKVIRIEYPGSVTNMVLYPNPARDVINVTLTERQELKLVNMQGVVVWKGILPAGQHAIPASNFAAGYYILQAGTKTFRVIVEQ